MSDTETGDIRSSSPVPSLTGGRHEKSLGLLTAKFVDLLQNAEGGVLDLKKVCVCVRGSRWLEWWLQRNGTGNCVHVMC